MRKSRITSRASKITGRCSWQYLALYLFPYKVLTSGKGKRAVRVGKLSRHGAMGGQTREHRPTRTSTSRALYAVCCNMLRAVPVLSVTAPCRTFYPWGVEQARRPKTWPSLQLAPCRPDQESLSPSLEGRGKYRCTVAGGAYPAGKSCGQRSAVRPMRPSREEAKDQAQSPACPVRGR